MDKEKVKLILRNMESLIKCLEQELNSEGEVERVTPFMSSDYDEVFLDEA